MVTIDCARMIRVRIQTYSSYSIALGSDVGSIGRSVEKLNDIIKWPHLCPAEGNGHSVRTRRKRRFWNRFKPVWKCRITQCLEVSDNSIASSNGHTCVLPKKKSSIWGFWWYSYCACVLILLVIIVLGTFVFFRKN